MLYFAMTNYMDAPQKRLPAHKNATVIFITRNRGLLLLSLLSLLLYFISGVRFILQYILYDKMLFVKNIFITKYYLLQNIVLTKHCLSQNSVYDKTLFMTKRSL